MSIRVVPEVGARFRRDLQEQLRRATQGLDIEVAVEAQTAGLRQEVQAAAREAGAGAEITIPVSTNRSMLDRLVSIFDRIFTSAGTVETPTLPLDDLRTFSVGLDGVAQQVEVTRQGFSRWAPAMSTVRNLMADLRGLMDRLRTSLANVVSSTQRATDAAGTAVERFKALDGALGAAGQDRTWSDRLRDLVSRLREAGPAVRDVLGGLRALPGLFSGIGRSSQESADGVRSTAAELRNLRDLGTFRFEADGTAVRVMGDAYRKMLDDLEALGKAHRRLGGDSERSGAGIRRENSLLSRSFSALGDLGSTALAGLGSVAVKVSDSIGGAFADVGQKLLGFFSTDGVDKWTKGLTDGMGKVAGGIGEALMMAVELGAAVFLVSGASTLLAIAGAAISAAWGAIATAIAVLPGLLVGVGAAAGVVYLGWDGIKAAAESLDPVLDRLTGKVSDVMEKGFRPLFEQVGRGLLAIEPQILTLAGQFVTLATEASKALSTPANAALLVQTLDNVGKFVAGIAPGIAAVAEGFLILGAQGAIWNMLGDSVNYFGERFKASVIDQIGPGGSFAPAVAGLEGTIKALTDAFIGLVSNGLELFAGAAPGVNAFIGDLTAFFERFDWNALGESVGGVFRGLGDVLKNVDQATIDGIATGFQRVSDAFQSEGFQTGMGKFIDSLPTILGWAASLIEVFGTVMGWIGTFVQFIDDQAVNLRNAALSALDGVGLLPPGVKLAFDAATAAAGEGSAATGAAASPTGIASQNWDAEGKRIADNIRAGIPGATGAGAAVSTGAYNGLNSRTGEAAGIGTALINGMARALRAGAGSLASIAGGIARDVIAAFKRAADINSPSGETEYIGRMIIAGLENSMRAGISDIRKVSAMVGAAAVMGIPAAATMDIGFTEPASYTASQYVTGDIAHQVQSEEFGYESMKEDLLDAMADWTFRQDPNATWKMVKNQDTRRNRRG